MRLGQARRFPLFLLLIFVLSAAASWTFGARARWVPAGCAVLGAALCLLLLARRAGTASPESGSGAWRPMLTLLLVAGAGALGGMLAAAPAAYLGYALFSEKRHWRGALTAAVVATLLVYVLFGLLLSVPLLKEFP